MNNYFQTSLARRFASLMIVFIILFVIGASIILYIQFHIQKDYEESNNIAEVKEEIIIQVDESFNQAILDVRGYIAFGNENLRERALSQRVDIQRNLTEFSELPLTAKDELFLDEIRYFDRYYFDITLPPILNDLEEGNLEAVVEVANESATDEVISFQNNIHNYRKGLDDKVEDNADALADVYKQMQWIMFAFVLFMLLILLSITRISLNRIGKPLRELAFAADKVSRGDETAIEFTPDKRKDEISILKSSFLTMISAIKENEQHLKDSNDELSEQQDELQAQQFELENLLGQMENRENQLRHRNKLIKSLSNSLDKNQVLHSIVKGFSGIIHADRGIIVLLDSGKTFAKWGISEEAASQFAGNLTTDGQIHRLMEERMSFVIKRNVPDEERGIHEGDQSCWDLYIPVLSYSGSVEAVMIYSRFSNGFSSEEIQEYSSLSKQVSLSLEKIKLFESSEADRLMNNDILNTIHEGIQLVDMDRRILHINQKFCSIYECKDPKYVIGRPFNEWLAGIGEKMQQPEMLSEFVDNLFTATAAKQLQYRMLHKQPAMIQVYAEPLYRRGMLSGWVLVHRDITKEYEADQLKNELVSTVSHELRTPLASVLGYTELLINRELKEERQKKYLNTIYQEAQRLTSLINDFLDVQRMEAGKQTYDKKYELLTPVIKKVIEDIRINTSIHDIQFVSDAEGDTVLGDRDKLFQVFQNLIQNAVKYSPDGGNITVKLSSSAENLHVSVIDEGLGIPDEAVPDLFTKFFRVDNTDRRKIGGTGLGLAIAKEIVKAHEGDINLSSTLGKGSTFIITLPKVSEVVESGSDTYLSAKQGKRIVVVEDDQQLASLLSNELRESGFVIKTFNNGEEALSFITENPPDAIILDIMLSMSQFDGLDVLQSLKNNPALSDIPVFVSTALDEKEKVMELGAEDFLVKPYSPSRLTTLVANKLV
jgi:signal transduction histidine kinase/CheY-like chemotaxis protein/HAMP domain-containing protein